jgi:hypothetical protein
VPNFDKEDVSLSGLVLAGGPLVPSVPEGALSGLMSVVPTTERLFSSTDEVMAFCRIFQRDRRGKPVVLTTRILDRQGTSVFEATETVTPDRFAAAESADHHFAVPLAELTPGACVLSVAAALDKDTSTTRTIAFTVR